MIQKILVASLLIVIFAVVILVVVFGLYYLMQTIPCEAIAYTSVIINLILIVVLVFLAMGNDN